MNAAERALFAQVSQWANRLDPREVLGKFQNPIVIFSAPRSGSTLLFETLQTSTSLWTIGGESHIAYSGLPQLHPANKGFTSGALDDRDATEEVCHWMRTLFLLLARDHRGRRYLDVPEASRPPAFRFLEKTPRNALNIPFMKKVFPQLQALFLYRDPRENIASIIEAWEEGSRTGRFVTFRDLPDWDRSHWCLLLPPHWQKMKDCSLAEIAAFQWSAANQTIMDNLRANPDIRFMPLSYRSLVDATEETITEITDFLDIPLTDELRERIAGPLPVSNTIVAAPEREKWRRHEQALEQAHHLYAPIEEALSTFGRV